jgi:YVTN family beta-propeller protein
MVKTIMSRRMNYKKLLITILSLLTIFICSNAQSRKSTKGELKFRSSYEGKVLSPDNMPVMLPYNRYVVPAGTQIKFGPPTRESHAMDVALSPDEKWLAIEGRAEVVIVSVKTGKIVATLTSGNFTNNPFIRNTYSGICWFQEGGQYKLWWGAVDNSIHSFVFQANWDTKKLTPGDTLSFEAVNPASIAIPNEVLVEKESGRLYLYIVLNGNDQVVKTDVATHKRVWTTTVGVAPFGLTKANGNIYVTNWAGSVPDRVDPHIAGVPWGSAKVDSLTGATREGTVSVLDPQSGKVLDKIKAGLHPNDVIASHDGKFVYVANANSDEVSVIATASGQITETIAVRLAAEKNEFWGDSPNGLALSKDGKSLYVANGLDNALAVVSLGRNSSSFSKEIISKVNGFIPTGAYPGGITVSGGNLLYVANIEGEGAYTPSETDIVGEPSYNSRRMMATVSVIPVPGEKELKVYTQKVEDSNQLFRLALLKKMPRKNIRPVPVPERIGEPSVFKHVLYIIKENRTYDQILGDMKKGDGDSSLTVFGRQVTPNTHKLCDEFILLDNFYVSGKCSAEGHQWSDASIVTDNVERNVGVWARSYPHVLEDALVYAPTGFIWDNALKNGKKVRIYGEACVPKYDKSYTWTSIYEGFLRNEKFEFANKTTIKPVEAILSADYPGYDDHRIPDVIRADAFIKELREFEKMEGDQFPELMVMALPNDHTDGVRPGLPTPRAMVANNDLSLGRIVEAVSKSRFWNSTLILVTEDDSQSGWDHVSAYRTVGMVISPWSRTGGVMHTNYNQPSMVRTIEQILGLPPMNIMDATASPMFDCFTAKPDMTPYIALENLIPLNEMNPPLSSLNGMALHYAKKNMEPQFDGIDSGEDDLFNRILWFAMKGKEKYPRKFSGKEED